MTLSSSDVDESGAYVYPLAPAGGASAFPPESVMEADPKNVLIAPDSVTGGDGEFVVIVRELDSTAADTFRTAMATMDSHSDLVVDLSALAFINHEGIDALSAVARSLGEDGRRLSVRGASSGVRQLLQSIGLHDSAASLPSR